MIPSLEFLIEKHSLSDYFLVGSDYVFPRTANEVVEGYLTVQGLSAPLGSYYVPLDCSISVDFPTGSCSTIIDNTDSFKCSANNCTDDLDAVAENMVSAIAAFGLSSATIINTLNGAAMNGGKSTL